MSDTDLVANVVVLTLLLVRTVTFVSVMPLFGGSRVPNQIKVGLATGLTMFWFGTAVPPEWIHFVESVPAHLAVASLREAVMGAALGFLFGLFLMPARMAGAYIGQELGLSMAQQTGAAPDEASGTVSHIFDTFGMLLFFSLDLHHIPIVAMDALLKRVPVGDSPATLLTNAPFMVAATSRTTEGRAADRSACWDLPVRDPCHHHAAHACRPTIQSVCDWSDRSVVAGPRSRAAVHSGNLSPVCTVALPREQHSRERVVTPSDCSSDRVKLWLILHSKRQKLQHLGACNRRASAVRSPTVPTSSREF